MVKADCSRLRGRGLESRRRILDGKLLQCNWKEKPEKINVAKWGKPTKNVFKKKESELPITCVRTIFVSYIIPNEVSVSVSV